MGRSRDDRGFVDDEELTVLAMSADPDQPLGPDAIPISFTTSAPTGLLPDWYMPAPASSVRGSVRRGVIVGLVVGLVVINAAGLCVTYGLAEIAW